MASAGRARAEAAERGRQLSRDWAEKQKMKKLGLKAVGVEMKVEEDSSVQAGGAVVEVQGVEVAVDV